MSSCKQRHMIVTPVLGLCEISDMALFALS